MGAELFDRAPDEVIRFFESKGQKVSFDWRDVAPEEHAYAFTVAKSAGYDILDDVRAAVSEAIAKGEAFDSFRSGLEPTLKAKGWWGRGLAFDDIRDKWTTGQLGSLRRLRTIYWANTSTARAAGEWDRIQRTKAYLPFLVYMRSTAERKRPLHAAWAAQPVVLPADDEWWASHYPPNGWLCKCSVRQVTRDEAAELGWSPQTDAPTVTMIGWRDRRNGRTIEVPEGIDPGWQTHVGLNRRRNVANFLGDRLAELPDAARHVALADILASPLFREVMASRGTVKMVVPVAPVQERVRALTRTSAEHVWLSSDSAKHILDDHKERGIGAAEIAMAVNVILTGTIKPALDPSRSLVFRGEAGGRLWRVAVKFLSDEAYLTSITPKSK